MTLRSTASFAPACPPPCRGLELKLSCAPRLSLCRMHRNRSSTNWTRCLTLRRHERPCVHELKSAERIAKAKRHDENSSSPSTRSAPLDGAETSARLVARETSPRTEDRRRDVRA